MITNRFFIAILFLTSVLMTNCTDKFDINDVNTGTGSGNINDTLYIKLSPEWTGFNKPQDILIGREPFVYVADTDNDRVVMLNVAGNILGTINIKHPVKLAQDYRLNLIVCGELVDINGTTYSAVFKLNLFDAQHQIANAKIDTLLPKSAFDFLRPDRSFTSAAVFSDNSFYIGRTGPANSNSIDPDNVILSYKVLKDSSGNRINSFSGKVPQLTPTGTGLLSANGISSITSFNNQGRDILISLKGENSFKVQWLTFVQTNDFTGYKNKLKEFASDIMIPGKFESPEDVTIDPSDNIYVIDSAKDSLYKFSAFGDERESFGGPEVFNSPHGVAYFNKTLYVADTENNRIVRYVLSTDL